RARGASPAYSSVERVSDRKQQAVRPWLKCPATFLAPRADKAPQLAEELARFFFGNEMAAVERPPTHVLGDLAPVGEAIEERLDDAVPAPEREHGHADLFAPILLVVHQVDRRRSAIVLAGRMDRARIAECAHIFGDRAPVEIFKAPSAAPEALEDVPGYMSGEQALGQRRFLDQEKPVPVGARELLRGALVH